MPHSINLSSSRILKLMSLHTYLNRIHRLDALIRQKRTGTPGELADKLGISERWLFSFLEEIKTELDCPIHYSRLQRSYIYNKPGKVFIGFLGHEELDRDSLKRLSGGANSYFSRACIYLCSNYGYITSTPQP